MRVETLLPQASVEAFHQGFIGGCAAPGEVQLHPVFICPPIHDLAGKLTPGVHLDRRRCASLRHQSRHRIGDVVAFQRLVNNDIQALMREVIHYRQRSETAIIEQCITDEVHAP